MSTPNPWAFPVPNDAKVNGDEGMSLRDYFAAAALQGFISSMNSDKAIYLTVFAETSYKLADAMLKERQS